MTGIVAGVLAAIVVIVWFFMFLGGWKSVPPDKVMLHYTGGPIQGTHFKEVEPPGTHTQFYGLLDHYYYLPATQRTYIISADPNAGDKKGVDVITAPSASPNSVPMTFEATAYFKINTNPVVLRQFFEQVCLHDDCTDLSPGGGWDKMLAQYFRPAMEQALRTEAGRYSYEDLWHNPDVRAKIQTAIGPVLADDINTNIGGQYFCGPDSTPTKCTPFGFVLQGANPPQVVIDAFSATAASQQGIVKAKADATAKEEAAKGDAAAQAARASAPPVPAQASDYIRAQAMAACAQNPNCKLVIVSGTGATVQVAP
jgi:regulator of protease activity HflC (stomatin/prohibitin superfamily)